MFNINSAEIIIEPFWDKCFSGIRFWNITGVEQPVETKQWWNEISSGIYDDKKYAVSGNGVRVSDSWCGVNFIVMSGRCLKMTREFQTNCENCDELVVSAIVAKGMDIIISAIVDGNDYRKEFNDIMDENKQEFVLPISGKTLETVTMTFSATGDSNGTLQWIMIRNKKLLMEIADFAVTQDENWYPYIKDETFCPTFSPLHNLIINNERLQEIKLNMSEEEKKMLVEMALKYPEPEQFISDYVNFWEDKRFARNKDYSNTILQKAPVIALAGLISKDSGLLRKALRYALAIAKCTNWQDSFICKAPGMIFEHKAFVASLCCEEISIVMDIAGELLTDTGKEYLLRRISEAGLGHINWIVWKYSGDGENIFKNNQLAWFSRGRISAYATLERYWSLIKSYIDLAYDELNSSIKQLILPDGGYDEGIGYFTAVSYMAGIAYWWYASARNIPFWKTVSKEFLKTADLAECLLSMDEEYDVIALSDSKAQADAKSYAFLAASMPKSCWVEMYHRAKKRQNEITTDIPTLLIEPSIPKKFDFVPRNFIYLPHNCIVSSVRETGSGYIKIVQCGGVANANHAHFDKGGFVVQYNGETIFDDPGIGEYGHSVGASMGGAEWHSIVLPIVENEMPMPINPKVDINLVAEGDAKTFHSTVDLLPAWDRYFKRLIRTIISDAPDKITVKDEYQVQSNVTGVKSSLITKLRVECKEDKIYIIGNHTTAILTYPKNCTAHIVTLPEYKGKVYKRIEIRNENKIGDIEVNVFLGLTQSPICR
jgi:hypothetical protein